MVPVDGVAAAFVVDAVDVVDDCGVKCNVGCGNVSLQTASTIESMLDECGKRLFA